MYSVSHDIAASRAITLNASISVVYYLTTGLFSTVSAVFYVLSYATLNLFHTFLRFLIHMTFDNRQSSTTIIVNFVQVLLDKITMYVSFIIELILFQMGRT